jgi:hypothetical protein
MEVIKLGKITIDEPFLKYYSLKQKYEARKNPVCPICNKGPLDFSVRNRTLLSTCLKNTLCRGNMSIPIPSFYTLDDLIQASQEKYNVVHEEVIRKKYDLLFKYSQDMNIQAIRDAYLKQKSKRDAIEVGFHKTRMLHHQELDDLYEQKQVLLTALKQPDMDLKHIQVDLNEVLNRIHKLEYHITGRVHVPYTPFTNMVPVLN